VGVEKLRVVLPHHDQQASDDQNQTEHGQMLSSSMLLLNLIQLIEVTFSTPTSITLKIPRLEISLCPIGVALTTLSARSSSTITSRRMKYDYDGSFRRFCSFAESSLHDLLHERRTDGVKCAQRNSAARRQGTEKAGVTRVSRRLENRWPFPSAQGNIRE
jgi:hypothetical protein